MEMAFNQFWELVWGALALNPEVFIKINTLPDGTILALAIVVLAGLSQTLGQCIVLFVNRVQPIRFLFSVLVTAVLFAFTYLFWGFSIWLVSEFILQLDSSPLPIFRTLGLSYAPQLLGFLIALPYLGIPISVVLSVWSLLAIVTASTSLGDSAGLNTWQALAATGLGWLALQLLQRTVGRPVAVLGQSILNFVAGTRLVRDRAELAELLIASRPLIPREATPSWLESINELQEIRHQTFRWPKKKLLTLAAVAFGILLAIAIVVQPSLSVWYATLDATVEFTINLIGITLIALLISILLTPLETLGWWAGWYGEDSLAYHGSSLVEEAPQGTQIARYVLYLDGINQGSYDYLPEVEQFLDELAKALPDNVLIVKGIMPYSAFNRPLTQGRPLSWLWRMIDATVLKNPANPIGILINIRNVVAVAISADPRYGPLQNLGLAQVLFDSLLHYGYSLEQQTPITLLGYSGGGQMAMGVVPFLKRATRAPIEVISISGVIEGSRSAMKVEHLYHLVGKHDLVEKLGPLMFPTRWSVTILSNWNRAKRRGRITFLSLGAVGHNGRNGPFGAEAWLPDGRSHLQQTVDLTTGILLKDWALAGLDPAEFDQVSNYDRYREAPFNQPSYYPIQRSQPRPTTDDGNTEDYYQPIGPWMGRLILPAAEERTLPRQIKFEVYHAGAAHQHLVGQIVQLGWQDDPIVQSYVQTVLQDVHFTDQARVSQRQGNVHPERLDHWQKVDPLESLAGARSVNDDIVVMLPEPIVVKEGDGEDTQHSPTLLISREPIQITGRFYALVTVVQPVAHDRFRVRHYNWTSQQFDGPEEVVYIPSVVRDRNGVLPSTHHQIEQSPLNSTGWYIYGAENEEGEFVVQAIAPRTLFALQPSQVIRGERDTLDYINYDYWKNLAEQKGTLTRVLLLPQEEEAAFPEGTRLLVMHLYGGIGGNQAEFAPMGIFFGHFAFGIAHVVREPLTDDLRFDIEYRQIYTHNTDGIVAGTHSWIRFIGDRQFGWLGSRPTSDILVQFPPLTEDYDFDGIRFSPMQLLIRELDAMAARYRTGDGTGSTFVGPINSCVQDSSQALYTAIKQMLTEIEQTPSILQWLQEHPEHEQTHRLRQLTDLATTIERTLTPLKIVRPDWKVNKPMLGSFPVETPLQTLFYTLASWRSLLPRLANDLIAMIFLRFGATLWVLRTNQIGGFDPDIEPIAPTDFSSHVPSPKTAEIEL